MLQQFMYEDGILPQGTVDLIPAVQKVVGRSGRKSKQFALWEPNLTGPSFQSCLEAGGFSLDSIQSTREWISDSICQLCKQCVGSLAHRTA